MRSTKTVLRNLNSKKGACEMREKSQVEDIDRSIYDIRDEEKRCIQNERRSDPTDRGAAFQRKGRSGMDAAVPPGVLTDLQ